ncbi:MAG: hypothetical protein R3D71_09145 [Rickettsiales bacterium]
MSNHDYDSYIDNKITGGGFSGFIGSTVGAITTAVKWVLGGLLAVTGVGFLLNKSEGFRDMTNKTLAKVGIDGAGDKGREMFTSVFSWGKDKVGIEAGKEDIITTENIGGVNVIKPTALLSEHRVVKNPKNFSDLTIQDKVMMSLFTSRSDTKGGIRRLEQLNDDVLEFASYAGNVWNPAAERYNYDKQELIKTGGLPAAPVINLSLPDKLSDKLEEYGKNNIDPEGWDSLSIIAKLKLLRTRIGNNFQNEPNLTKSIMDGKDYSDDRSILPIWTKEALSYLVKQYDGDISDGIKDRGESADTRLEVRTKRDIAEQLKEGRYGEAKKLAMVAHDYYDGISLDPKIIPYNDKDRGTRYGNVAKSFKEIVDYIDSIDENGIHKELLVESNRIFNGILEGAHAFSITEKEYIQKVNAYRTSVVKAQQESGLLEAAGKGEEQERGDKEEGNGKKTLKADAEDVVDKTTKPEKVAKAIADSRKIINNVIGENGITQEEIPSGSPLTEKAKTAALEVKNPRIYYNTVGDDGIKSSSVQVAFVPKEKESSQSASK